MWRRVKVFGMMLKATTLTEIAMMILMMVIRMLESTVVNLLKAILMNMTMLTMAKAYSYLYDLNGVGVWVCMQ